MNENWYESWFGALAALYGPALALFGTVQSSRRAISYRNLVCGDGTKQGSYQLVGESSAQMGSAILRTESVA